MLSRVSRSPRAIELNIVIGLTAIFEGRYKIHMELDRAKTRFELIMLRDFFVASLRRAWLGFAGLTLFGFVAFLIIDRDNLLRSDDAYLVGFLLGGIAAGMSLVYSIAESCARVAGGPHSVSGSLSAYGQFSSWQRRILLVKRRKWEEL